MRNLLLVFPRRLHTYAHGLNLYLVPGNLCRLKEHIVYQVYLVYRCIYCVLGRSVYIRSSSGPNWNMTIHSSVGCRIEKFDILIHRSVELSIPGISEVSNVFCPPSPTVASPCYLCRYHTSKYILNESFDVSNISNIEVVSIFYLFIGIVSNSIPTLSIVHTGGRLLILLQHRQHIQQYQVYPTVRLYFSFYGALFCTIANVWNLFLDTCWVALRFRVGDGFPNSVVAISISGKPRKPGKKPQF